MFNMQNILETNLFNILNNWYYIAFDLNNMFNALNIFGAKSFNILNIMTQKSDPFVSF